MNEVRRVIGVCDHTPPVKNGVAFPTVRTWLRGLNDYVTRDLQEYFPSSGTVFLHVSACENREPSWNDIGLFECIESGPGRSAAWKVSRTTHDLARVVVYSKTDSKWDPLDFAEWLEAFRDCVPYKILLGVGAVYARHGSSRLLGPFSISEGGRLSVRDQTYAYNYSGMIEFDLDGKPVSFVDVTLLPRGKPIALDPKEIIQRRLKVLNKANYPEWLSRTKVQELSAALANVIVDDGADWMQEDLPKALELLVQRNDVDAKLVEEILGVKGVAIALEAAWVKSHEDDLKNARLSLASAQAEVGETRAMKEHLNHEIGNLTRDKIHLEETLARLHSQVDAASFEAQQAHKAELTRLAQSPATMAVLGAWLGAAAQRNPARGEPLIRIQEKDAQIGIVDDFKVALFTNFKSCNLSPQVASELAVVSKAALAAGQPIAFKSLLGDSLADAVAIALGQQATMWADIPAGILDPIDWELLGKSSDKRYTRILQNADRSNISLVLGSLRGKMLRQSLGHQLLQEAILITMDTYASAKPHQELLIGPIIEEGTLRFNPGKGCSGFTTVADFKGHLPHVGPVSADDFAEIGEHMQGLPLFAMSAHEAVFRRAFAALKLTCDNTNDAVRLLFKFWCLPRSSRDDAIVVLDAHKQLWAQDKMLMETRDRLERNE